MEAEADRMFGGMDADQDLEEALQMEMEEKALGTMGADQQLEAEALGFLVRVTILVSQVVS
eukprot:CAMPEP_0167746644 /NCGR_PEP_ID=MMETSP0110_2-20121227/3827_1 /TAXON_ID=629695 /ORGANISM="Gymnochlora sp., Strain CCMP2014" /LENGTH=60 /DNA_ID=CAMNT_0007631431 /DNA_START=516 /DNA_END=695 /DNA_ORIENTATION=-